MKRCDLNSGLNVLIEDIRKKTNSKKSMIKVFFAGG